MPERVFAVFRIFSSVMRRFLLRFSFSSLRMIPSNGSISRLVFQESELDLRRSKALSDSKVRYAVDFESADFLKISEIEQPGFSSTKR